ncbi:MAG: 2-iminoacetate synthase ThiH [Candidatus Omnitrophota bacterium]|nr:2-iminoacetate synthase ThiH [Candidatus Omnitrophota bacterium]
MSFHEIYSKYSDFDLNKAFDSLSNIDINRAIDPGEGSIKDLISLLSPAAESSLETMAARSRDLTLKYFGRTIQLYTPMYLSNYCENRCLYCGFNASNKIERRSMSPEEVEKEAQFISATGLRHILILTGESRSMSPVSYIKESVKILKRYFSSISLEVYPLSESEYSELISEGVDGLTIYQEVYDKRIYNAMHPLGPKNDYVFRLDTPERGARAGMRNVNIGVLLGLNDWRREVFSMALHAKYLQDKLPDVDIGVSVPRIRPQVGGFKASCVVTDKNIVQIILALRIFLPRLGITVSTRESAILRENLVPLGITRMSAGSTTRVGGHTIEKTGSEDNGQFEISDRRSVDEIKTSLEKKGYQAVFKDWMHI